MVWCGVVWCGVMWCDVVWYGVVWCGVAGFDRLSAGSETGEGGEVIIGKRRLVGGWK